MQMIWGSLCHLTSSTRQDGATTKTSQINADEFTEYFEGFLKEGKDILHVCLSSGITGVVNSANIAREELAEKYPDRKILIVDSLGDTDFLWIAWQI